VVSGLAVAVGVVLFLGGFAWAAVLYRPYTVPTDSMAPTVDAGARVFAQRVGGSEVRRGDVVVFRDPVWGDLPMVKRVVGVGGDAVACCDERGRLTVNGKPVEEPYLQKAQAASTGRFDASVPGGRLFLLGDNRSTSQDSRVHLANGDSGAVSRSAVDARVEATAWPPEDMGMLARATGFGALPGGVSEPGPLPLITGAVTAGAVLVLGGAAYGPVSGSVGRRRNRGRG
jgi:signal peptidase I